MKKVLIITYYWPPSGGAGVQRWLKFSKYLHDFGWEPVIYTSEGGEAPAIDESLLKEVRTDMTVIKQPIWEPYSWYKKLIGQKKEERINAGFLAESKKPAKTQKLAVWIRGNIFIPDARRFWIKPSVRFLSKYLKEHPVDAMISTGPPHSMHVIALKLKEKMNIPWIADFRDPWTNIDFYDQLMLTNWADKKHKQLEQAVLKKADKVVTVSWNWAKDFQKLGVKEIDVITNGFDGDDFDVKNAYLTEEFSISHIGSLNKDRNPGLLWQALEELSKEKDDFKEKLRIRLVGKTDYSILEDIQQHGLADCLEKIEYLPHKEAINLLCTSQVLLLPINNAPNLMGIIPGKLFEYLAARRPVLLVGPANGDSASIITSTQSGVVCEYKDKKKMKAELSEMFEKYKANSLYNKNSGDIELYSRKEGAHQYAVLLNKIIKK